MEGLFSLLVFAGLFFLMMRFGCGAHIMHGGGRRHHHGGGKETGKGVTNHRDPVCGMSVEPNKGYGKMYREELYRFCSRECLDKFEANPNRYLTTPALEDKS